MFSRKGHQSITYASNTDENFISHHPTPFVICRPLLIDRNWNTYITNASLPMPDKDRMLPRAPSSSGGCARTPVWSTRSRCSPINVAPSTHTFWLVVDTEIGWSPCEVDKVGGPFRSWHWKFQRIPRSKLGFATTRSMPFTQINIVLHIFMTWCYPNGVKLNACDCRALRS